MADPNDKSKKKAQSTSPAATPTKPKARPKMIVRRSPTTRSQNTSKEIVQKGTTKKQPPPVRKRAKQPSAQEEDDIEEETPDEQPVPKARTKKQPPPTKKQPPPVKKTAKQPSSEQVKPKPASTKKPTKKQPPPEQEEEVDEETEDVEEPAEKRSKEKHDKVKPKPASTKKPTKKQPTPVKKRAKQQQEEEFDEEDEEEEEPAEKPKPASKKKPTKKQPPPVKKRAKQQQEEQLEEEDEEDEEPVQKRSKVKPTPPRRQHSSRRTKYQPRKEAVYLEIESDEENDDEMDEETETDNETDEGPIEKKTKQKHDTAPVQQLAIQTAAASTSKKRKTQAKKKTKLQLVDESDPETKVIQRKKPKKQFEVARNRSSPGALLSLIQGLSKEQKDCVTEMGFESLLQMKMSDVPGALIYYVLERFDPQTCSVVLPIGKIQITRELVNQILGFPLGSIKFKEMEFRSKEDLTYLNWAAQFDNKNSIRLQDIKMKIASSNLADMNFKMNFIALMINSLCESSSCGKANYSNLNYITADTVVKDIDWCSYVIDCLLKSKFAYKHSNTAFFVGPAAFLVLLYVDSVKLECIHVQRTRPVICHWTTEKLKFREMFEREMIGGFGTGELNGVFVEEDINEQDYESMVLRKKAKLETVVKKGVEKFPQNVRLNLLKEEMCAEVRADGGENMVVSLQVDQMEIDGIVGDGRNSMETTEKEKETAEVEAVVLGGEEPRVGDNIVVGNDNEKAEMDDVERGGEETHLGDTIPGGVVSQNDDKEEGGVGGGNDPHVGDKDTVGLGVGGDNEEGGVGGGNDPHVGDTDTVGLGVGGNNEEGGVGRGNDPHVEIGVGGGNDKEEGGVDGGNGTEGGGI